MTTHNIDPLDKTAFNEVMNHPLQAYEWGEFRKTTGVKVIRRGFFQEKKIKSGFQLTIHKIPKTPFCIGYLPKSDLPNEDMLLELKRIGMEEKCIFIQLEPNIDVSQISNFKFQISNSGLRPATHPLFTKYNFVLDITPNEEELLKNMHQKARYNIRVAQKHGVEIHEDNSDKAFAEYLKLTEETTTRQRFYAHTQNYHKLQWQALKHKISPDSLSSHLFVAKYKEKILTTWILFVFKDTLYYPYGASSSENRDVMASNLIMWEAIRFGKKLGLKKFDMWGALGPNPDTDDPWYGFHNFKQKYGPRHVEYVGSYDLIINPVLYELYKIADKLRWLILKIKK